MLRLIILAVLGYFLYRLLRGFFSSGQDLRKSENAGSIDEMVQDPLCKTYIPLRDARRKVIDGKEYFFCSGECAGKFKSEREGKK